MTARTMSTVPRKWASVAFITTIVGVAASLLTLALPPSQASTTQISFDGKTYWFESESLFANASWLNYSYRG